MDANNHLLKKSLYIIVILFGFNCCNDKKIKEDINIYDTESKFLTLNNAKGKYYFVPSLSDNQNPNYKTFSLKKGDTLYFEIKSDSTFIYNYFYHDRMRRIDNYKGKIIKNLVDKNKIFIPFPNGSFDVQGFLTTNKDTIFYTRLSMEHYENYEYQLFYKKVK
ncbi:hypothetical protein [Frigoriflavimonas asaccharolytica]|uniref:Uncharacterized protein n=1 Tax=Frigoriflavimonas asaccharolytica TaxID=2735899 RepID=A0A8J8GCC3_9FLAO|nr:hypothetical protein [Frigoriflavimonas asaccharolytica]NRS93912.1 hypothetical protein [Frigoriflavimonas asaccharolytica]